MIVKNLRASREYILNISQIQLSKILNVHPSTISGWETGKDTIPIKRLIQYANMFNFSLDFLFGVTNKNREYQKLILDLDILSMNLKRIRKSNNMTQSKVANLINTNQNSYTHYETGINIIPTSFLYNLTKIYRPFSIDELFGRKRIK